MVDARAALGDHSEDARAGFDAPGSIPAPPALRLIWICTHATSLTLQIDGEGDRETQTVLCDEQPRSIVISRTGNGKIYMAVSTRGAWQLHVEEQAQLF